MRCRRSVAPLVMLFACVAAAQSSAGAPLDLTPLEQQALAEAEAGKTADALRDYRQALALRPEWKEGWWNLGALEYGANQFAAAKATFLRVVSFAPNLGAAWSLLGLSEYETGDYAAALDHLEKANALGIADDAEVERVSSYHLGLLLIRDSQFERASELLLKSFGSGVISPQIQTALGLATLRVPLLPEQVDPSREALVAAVGAAAGAPDALEALLAAHPDIPYLHYACGVALANAGREQEALAPLLAETKISPQSPLPWAALARLELRLGAPVEASEAARQATALEPGGRALAEPRIVALYSSGSGSGLPGADDHLKDQLWSRAMQEYSLAQYAAAAAELKEWLRANAGNGTGWAVLGLCEFAMQDYDNALIHLDRGATLGLSGSAQSLQQARYTYGALLVRAGQFDRGSEVLMAALGGAGQQTGKVQDALGLALLRRAQLPAPESPPLVSGAGRIAVLLRQSKYDDAFALLKPLLAEYPSTPFLHYAYGTALLALSQYDEAAAQMLRERAISPLSELPCVRLASIALRQHHAADALAWSRRALALNTKSVEAHYLLGRASLEAGDDATALSELQAASKLSPASPEIHFNLAKAYARARMLEQAEQERRTFAELSALAEAQRDTIGGVYTGPRDAGEMTSPPPSNPAQPILSRGP